MLTITKGRTYRAKQPAAAGHACVNDRQVAYVTRMLVGYIDPGTGAPGLTTTHEEFQKWAERDVTAELPPGGWAPYTKGIK